MAQASHRTESSAVVALHELQQIEEDRITGEEAERRRREEAERRAREAEEQRRAEAERRALEERHRQEAEERRRREEAAALHEQGRRAEESRRRDEELAAAEITLQRLRLQQTQASRGVWLGPIVAMSVLLLAVIVGGWLLAARQAQGAREARDRIALLERRAERDHEGLLDRCGALERRIKVLAEEVATRPAAPAAAAGAAPPHTRGEHVAPTKVPKPGTPSRPAPTLSPGCRDSDDPLCGVAPAPARQRR
jgi:hypothetical protein